MKLLKRKGNKMLFNKKYKITGRENIWFIVKAWSIHGFSKVLISDGKFQTVVRPSDLIDA